MSNATKEWNAEQLNKNTAGLKIILQEFTNDFSSNTGVKYRVECHKFSPGSITQHHFINDLMKGLLIKCADNIAWGEIYYHRSKQITNDLGRL